MRIKRSGISELMTIYEAKMPPGRGVLDPITVILRDFGGSGQIIVECYGDAWAHWFGAIGNDTLREFIAACSDCYLATKLTISTVRKNTKREDTYVKHIARAIIQAMKGGET